jgi:hypothetical protein
VVILSIDSDGGADRDRSLVHVVDRHADRFYGGVRVIRTLLYVKRAGALP